MSNKGYDNVNSIKLKAEYIIKENLGGAMFWTIDLGKYLYLLNKKQMKLIFNFSIIKMTLLENFVVKDIFHL